MSNTKRSNSLDIKKLVYIAVLTALVVVLELVPKIPFGVHEFTLSMPVIVIGGALFDSRVGSWLGLIFSLLVLIDPTTAGSLSLEPFGTILIVFVKGVLAGLLSALIYKLLQRINKYFAILVASVIATIVNTGIYIAGVIIFFDGDLHTIITGFVAMNFLLEMAVCVVLAPTVYKIINITKKV